MNSSLIKLIAALTLATAGTAAFAHEGEDHGKKAGPVKKEQKDWGIASAAKAGIRTVEIKMSDTMRVTPDQFEVKQGETVRLVMRNTGAAAFTPRMALLAMPSKSAAARVFIVSTEASKPTSLRQ